MNERVFCCWLCKNNLFLFWVSFFILCETGGAVCGLLTSRRVVGWFRVASSCGSVLLFVCFQRSGDLMSLHAGSEVVDGVKWAANKWIWNFPSD